MSENRLTIEIDPTLPAYEGEAVLVDLLRIPGAEVKVVEEVVTVQKIVGVTVPTATVQEYLRRI